MSIGCARADCVIFGRAALPFLFVSLVFGREKRLKSACVYVYVSSELVKSCGLRGSLGTKQKRGENLPEAPYWYLPVN